LDGQKKVKSQKFFDLLLTFLEVQNQSETIIQKIAVTICNITSGYKEILTEDVVQRCAKKLNEYFFAFEEPMTKIFIIQRSSKFPL
jgi:hypothetical protein